MVLGPLAVSMLASCAARASDGESSTTASAPTVDGFLASCDPVPEPSLPPSCAGPDEDRWVNAPRPDDAGPCPPPPAGGCEQVVLGRLADTSAYIGCPGYIVLHRSDWTIDVNDHLIACVAECRLGTCQPAAIVVSPRASIPDFHPDYHRTSVTSRELCQLDRHGCSTAMADEHGPGAIDCGCRGAGP